MTMLGNQPLAISYQLFSDYHTHPQGHRVQPYTQKLLQPWANSARRLGLKDIAFTDHDRYHAGIEFDEIDRLRDRNPDLQIRAGSSWTTTPSIHRLAANGSKKIGTNWISFSARCISLSAPIKCST